MWILDCGGWALLTPMQDQVKRKDQGPRRQSQTMVEAINSALAVCVPDSGPHVLHVCSYLVLRKLVHHHPHFRNDNRQTEALRGLAISRRLHIQHEGAELDLPQDFLLHQKEAQVCKDSQVSCCLDYTEPCCLPRENARQ